MTHADDADDNEPRYVEINKAVRKEMEALPEKIRDQFLFSLEQVSLGLKPSLSIAHLGTVGDGVVEMKVNGSPAYRLVYTTKLTDRVVVLAARQKSKQGTDQQLLKVSASRLKSYN